MAEAWTCVSIVQHCDENGCKHPVLLWQVDAVSSSAQRQLCLMVRSLERKIFTPRPFPYLSSLRCSVLSPKMTAVFGQNPENWSAPFFPCHQDWLYSLPLTALILLHVWKQDFAWQPSPIHSSATSHPQTSPPWYFPADCYCQETHEQHVRCWPHIVLSDGARASYKEHGWTWTPVHSNNINRQNQEKLLMTLPL